MDQRFIKLILLLCSLCFLPQAAQASLFAPKGGSQFVPVDRAFAFDFKQQGGLVTLNWQIRPGYYLYRQQIKLVPQQATLGVFTLPEGLSHKDEFFGEVAIFKQQLNLQVPLQQAAANASLSVTYQGCAEAGFCYPPETRTIPLDAVSATAAAPLSASAPAEAPAAPASLPFSPLWALLIGIGIAFTPCVLPMYPLISGIILGRDRPQSSGRILALAVVYVQGMALTYTLLGLVVAAAGLQFQAALQHPYVLIGLSVLFIALALSMFGLYSLQLPSALQTRLANWSNTQRGGSLTGVFLMGALAGLICSPCTTAPLSAILLYIAQSGNLWAGGGTLYLYALGMGIPLVIVTLFGNRLLPRSAVDAVRERSLRLRHSGAAGVPAGAGDRRSVGHAPVEPARPGVLRLGLRPEPEKRTRLGARPATAVAGGGGDRRTAATGLGFRRRPGAAGDSATPGLYPHQQRRTARSRAATGAGQAGDAGSVRRLVRGL